MKTFSKDWTDEERLKIILLLAGQIQTDIPAGNYGAVIESDEHGLPTKFRPNMQSILNAIFASKDALENSRAYLEALVIERLPKDEREGFFKPLEEMREEVFP
jgi:hypothetical protein